MKAEIVTLCDFANAEPVSGKLNIIGTFDHLNVPQVPVMWPSCFVAVKIRSERLEEGQKRIQMLFVDADGNNFANPIDIQIPIILAPGESTATLQFVVNLQQLKLSSFGEYAIDLRVDTVSLAAIPLYVRQIQPPGQSQPQQ